MQFIRLFTPISIHGLELKNRVIMSAIHHLYTPEGFATDRFNRYYWRRAEGGVGLIMVGGCRIDECGGAVSMISLTSDVTIPGYKEFTAGIHARGAKVGAQLYHAGRYAHKRAMPEDVEALAPSSVYSSYTRETPREMSVEELKGIVAAWARAAGRAKASGFDLVEIVGSAGYLICQFLSPVTNLRKDEYGGSWENRTRFAREVVAAVRGAVGPDYPVGMRIAGNDFIPGSNSNAQAVDFARLMEQCGVDLLNVTGGWHESTVPQITGDLPAGGYTYLAKNIKATVKIPVAASNRINNPMLAEKILALGVSDLVSLGRPLIADPDWVNKAAIGHPDEIRRCVACNQGCLAKTFFAKPIECLVNGSAGREYLLTDIEKAEPKNLLVVGAGPAGCEFAIAATERGHAVTIWEKEHAIGGQLAMVATPPGKRDFNGLIDYYRGMLQKSGVNVVLGKEGCAQEIANAGFDAVCVSTGMVPKSFRLPGEDRIPVYSAYDILKGNAVAGKNVVLIGGGSVGCETAQFLAHEASITPEQVYFLLEHRAEEVSTVLEMMNRTDRQISIVDIVKIGSGFEPGTGWPVLKDLKRLGVSKYSFSEILHVGADSVVIQSIAPTSDNAEKKTILCDTIVMAVGAAPNNTLFNELRELGVQVHNIGDSNQIGKVLDAVRSATELANTI